MSLNIFFATESEKKDVDIRKELGMKITKYEVLRFITGRKGIFCLTF